MRCGVGKKLQLLMRRAQILKTKRRTRVDHLGLVLLMLANDMFHGCFCWSPTRVVKKTLSEHPIHHMGLGRIKGQGRLRV